MKQIFVKPLNINLSTPKSDSANTSNLPPRILTKRILKVIKKDVQNKQYLIKKPTEETLLFKLWMETLKTPLSRSKGTKPEVISFLIRSDLDFAIKL